MTLRTLLVVSALPLLVASCSDPSAGKPKATTSDVDTTPRATTSSGTTSPGTTSPGTTTGATATSTTTSSSKPSVSSETAKPATASGPAYTFDGAGSKVSFIGAKITGKHDGGFGTFKGTIHLADGDAEKGSVSVEIDTSSVTTDSEKLTGHIKSPDFFDVAKHPNATFESTSVKKGGGSGATHTISGNLTLHGVTKAISFPAKIQTAADNVSVDAEFSINRKDFGINYPGKVDDLIKDDVLIKLTIKAKKS